MAARYWVGGTGNWSDATNHWSDASGGAPGAGFLPTSADDVFIDSNSFTVDNTRITINTVCNCRNIDTTDVSFSGQTYLALGGTLNIYGSIYNKDDSFLFTVYGGQYYYLLSTTLCYIDLNGGIIQRPYINGVGGEFTLLSDLLMTNLIVSNGTLDANGYSIYGITITLSGGAFYLRAGVLEVDSWNISGTAVFYCGTSSVTITSQYLGITTTFYNLTFFPGIPNGGIRVMFYTCNIAASLTITNLLTLKGLDGNLKRAFIRKTENYLTTPIVLTAENVYAENISLFMIRGAGNADWDLSAITGGAGNAGFNQGIVFTAPQPQYYKYISGDCFYSNTAHWFLATDGGGGAGRMPLPQDEVVFDENSFSSPITMRWDSVYLGLKVNMSSVDVSVTITFYNPDFPAMQMWCFGDFILGSNVSITVNNHTLNIWASANVSISLFGAALQTLYVFNRGITCLLLSNGIVRGAFTTHCSFDLNSYYWTVGSWQIETQTYTVIWLRAGTVEFTSGGMSYSGGLTINVGTSLLYFNPTGTSDIRVFTYYNSFYNVIFGGSHTGNFRIGTGQGSVYPSANYWYFNNITINAGRKLQIGTQQNISVKSFTAVGTQANPITITTFSVSGVFANHKLRNELLSDIVVQYCIISYSNVIGTLKIKSFLGKTWASMSKAAGIAKASIKKIMGIYVNSAWIANSSTDSGNNSGWNFNP